MTQARKRDLTPSDLPSAQGADWSIEFREQLLSRRADILNQSNVNRSHLDQQSLSAPGDVGDISVLDTSTDYFLQLAQHHQSELIEIRDALERMRRGTYGVCETCEESIQFERLKRLPYARLCVACQTTLERKQGSKFRTISPKSEL